MDIQKNMATVIRALKKESGKSLAELSEELEISRSALQAYLAGTGNPNVRTIEHLANKLGVDVAVLISGVFTYDQAVILLHLMDMLGLLDQLKSSKRRRFAELLLEMTDLWDKEVGEP